MKFNSLIMTIVLFWTPVLFAGFLRIIPNVQLLASEKSPGRVQVTGTIENEGDESAQAVAIEMIRNNKILAEVGTLGAGEEKEVSVEVAEGDIGVDKEGSYNIPLRVLYKDNNHASFSAAFIGPYSKKGDVALPLRSSPIVLRLGEVVLKAGGVDIAKSGSFLLAVSNSSAVPLDVNLEFVGTKEVEIKTESSKLSLTPQEEKTIEVTVKNTSALPGSSYASYVLVSGIMDGALFSDYIGFVVNIRSKADIPVLTWLLVVLAAVFAIVGFVYWRRESASSDSEHDKNV